MYYIKKEGTDALTINDMNMQWLFNKKSLLRNMFFSQNIYSETAPNILIDDCGSITSGSINNTVTSNLEYCYYIVDLYGKGNFENCTFNIDKEVLLGSEFLGLGEPFLIAEDSFNYEINVIGSDIVIYNVIISAFKYGEPEDNNNFVILT